MLAPARQSVPSPASSASGKGSSPIEIPVTASLRDVERIHIERVLKARNWNQSGAAQALGIDRKTLRNKIREFHLDRDGDGG